MEPKPNLGCQGSQIPINLEVLLVTSDLFDDQNLLQSITEIAAILGSAVKVTRRNFSQPFAPESLSDERFDVIFMDCDSCPSGEPLGQVFEIPFGQLNAPLVRFILQFALQRKTGSTAMETEMVLQSLNAHACVAVTDAKGIIKTVNEKFCEISGFSRRELVGENHRFLSSDNHPQEFFEQLWSTVLSGRAWKGILKTKSKDGRLFWLDTTVLPFKNQSGHIRHLVTVHTDVTSLKEQLEQDLARTVSSSHLLANVSHEIRTPLQAILGASDLLRDSLSQTSEAHSPHLQTLEMSTKMLLRMINDLLDYSKLSAQKTKIEKISFEFNEIASALKSILGSIARARGVELQIASHYELPRLMGDPNRIQQILLNLLGNGIKFTEVGFVALFVDYSDQKQSLQLSVTDTGCGMAESTVARLFQPFEQGDDSTARKYGGTGLGLTISKDLVELMGGKIEVLSHEGLGSTFTVTLPIEKALPGASDDRPPKTDPKGGYNQNMRTSVALVEDDHISGVITQTLLIKAGCETHLFETGGAALEFLSGTAVSCVLVDNHLPDMAGLDVLQRLRSGPGPNFKTPVVGFSGDDRGWELIRAEGFADWIHKPARSRKIIETVQTQAQLNT